MLYIYIYVYIMYRCIENISIISANFRKMVTSRFSPEREGTGNQEAG